MEKRTNSIIGLGLMIIGTVFIMNAFSGITGYAIVDDVNINASTILGLILFIGGIALIQYRDIARTQSEEYRVGTGEVLEDYKAGKISAIEAAQTIDIMEPIRGVDYSGGEEGWLYLRRGKPIPIKFATVKEGRELCDALADEALENNPRNARFIKLPEGKRSKPRRKVHKG